MRACCNGHRVADDDFDVIEMESGELLCGPCQVDLAKVRPSDSEFDKLGRLKGGGKKPTPQSKVQ